MNSSRKSKYEALYNIKLEEFYYFITDVMHDFGYSMYRTEREVEARRRIEIWVHKSDEQQKAMVWIEVLKPSEALDPYLTTDVLRAMNDVEVTRLFFFTNGELTDEDRDILEGKNHFIFSTDEIVDTLTSIETKKVVKFVKKRKPVKIPSASVLIKNFFKTNDIKKKQIKLKTSATPELVDQYVRLIKKILGEIDRVKDINEIHSDVKDKLKKIQYNLLPELAKTSSYIFPKQFVSLRNLLFNLVQVTILYIGNFVNYEAEDELKHNREIIEEILLKLDEVDHKMGTFKSDMMYQSERNAVNIILTSGAITFIALILLIVVRFAK